MASSKGSVRMGPVSLFTLVIVLCLAVMSVLAVSTAKASYASASRQASSVTDVYACEQSAQLFVADLDSRLAEVRRAGGTRDDALASLSGQEISLATAAAVDGVTISVEIPQVQLTGSPWIADLRAQFTTEDGHCLSVEISIEDDASYQILKWKTSTEWTQNGSGDVLWQGAAS